MVAQITLRTYGIYQILRFVEGIWLHRKSRQIQIFFGKDLFYLKDAQHVLPPSFKAPWLKPDKWFLTFIDNKIIFAHFMFRQSLTNTGQEWFLLTQATYIKIVCSAFMAVVYRDATKVFFYLKSEKRNFSWFFCRTAIFGG